MYHIYIANHIVIGTSETQEVEVEVYKPDSVRYIIDDVTVHLERKYCT